MTPRTPRRDPAIGPRAVPRRVVLAALPGTLGLALAGCARIPLDSGVSSTPARQGADPGAPYVQPRPPADGASPSAIVAGFVQAGVGADDDYDVARQYLTEQARTSWDPEAGITVYAADQEVETSSSGSGTVRLALQAISQVDAHGARSVLPAPVSREFDVALQQEAGQWRISKPPDGIFLSQTAFEILFVPGRAYFLDARERHLVPDVRWVLSQDAASMLIQHLAAGPSPHLAQAVHSALPAAFPVASGAAAPADDGTTVVQLPASLQALAADRRALALAQIDASLSSLAGLSKFSITSGGTTLTPDASVHLDRPLVGHRPIAAGEAGVISLSDLSGQGAAPQLVPDLAGEVVHQPVIAQTLPLAAALRADLRAVLIAATDGSIPRRDVDLGAALVGPTIDDAGYVWTAIDGVTGSLRALSAGDAAADVTIASAWLDGREVRCLEVAADATRLLVLSAADDGTRLDVCGIVRDGRGAPSALTEPIQVATGLGAVQDATWYDEVAVIALGSDPVASTVEPTAATGQDGTTAALRAVTVDAETGTDALPDPRAGSTRIAGTAVTGQVLASSEAAVLLRSDGSSWVAATLAARDPSYY